MSRDEPLYVSILTHGVLVYYLRHFFYQADYDLAVHDPDFFMLCPGSHTSRYFILFSCYAIGLVGTAFR